MSEKYDKMKKVRLYPKTYKKIRSLQKAQPTNPSLSHFVNLLLEISCDSGLWRRVR
jgi:hypothetical protein